MTHADDIQQQLKSKPKIPATNAKGLSCSAWGMQQSDPPLCSAHAGLAEELDWDI